ncbi:unnamed protein product [Boreogadus saida]
MEAHLWSRDECGAAASLWRSADAAAAARANAPHPIGWGGLKWEQEVALRPAELIYLDPGSGEGACGRQHIGIYSNLRVVTLLAVTVSGCGNLRLLEEKEELVVMEVVVVVVEVVVLVLVVVVRSPTGGQLEAETGSPEPPKSEEGEEGASGFTTEEKGSAWIVYPASPSTTTTTTSTTTLH